MLKSIFGNGAAVIVAQFIGLASMAVVARWYDPAQVGGFGIAIAAVTLLKPLATLSFESAICVARIEGEALSLARLALLSTAILTLAGIFMVILIGETEAYGLAIPFLLASAAGLTIITQASFRKHLIGVRALSLIASALIVAALRVAGGILVPGAMALILASLAGNLSAIGFLAWRGPGIRPSRLFSGRRNLLAMTARRYRQFPQFIMPHALLRSGIIAVPTLALGWRLGQEVAGQYALAASIIGGPILMIADALGDVVTRPLVQAYRQNKSVAKAMVRRLTLQTAIVATAPVLVLWTVAHPLFSLMFGRGWDQAAEFAQWLSLWGGAMLATRPLTCLTPILNLHRRQLETEVLMGSLRLIGFVFALLELNDAMMAVAIYSLLGLLQTLVMSALVINRLNNQTYVGLKQC